MSASDVTDAPAAPAQPSTIGRRVLNGLLIMLVWVVLIALLAGLGWATYRFNVNRYRALPAFVRFILPQLKIMGLCALALLATTTVVVGLQFLASRWRTLRIFVTYHHAALDEVTEIVEALKGDGIDARFIPFAERDHDELIHDVRQHIRQCDAVVAVPGTERSFIDAELLSASTLGKPIIIVKHKDGQTLPDTVYRGYPVLDLSKLRVYDHHPLARLFRFACNHRRDVPLNLLRALSGTGAALLVIASAPVALSLPSVATDLLITFGFTTLAFKVALWTYWTFLILFIGIFGLAFASGVIAKLRAIRTVRQEIITHTFTYEALEKALSKLPSDARILICLERTPLPLRH